MNFVYEKAFDSVDRETRLKLFRQAGKPDQEFICRCRVVHDGRLAASFSVQTGVRQGCLLSPFFFLLAIDCVVKTSTALRRYGIQWTLQEHFNDLDFAGDLALLSYGRQQMQAKTVKVCVHSHKDQALQLQCLV